MSEENKQPTPEEQEPIRPVDETPAAEEAKQTPEKTPEKPKKESKKREKAKTYSLTQEQMEAAELAARQLSAAKEQFLRLTAEYDNYRKRTAKEKESIYQDAQVETIKAFLPVYDNLERAAASEPEDSPHKKGLEMIFDQFKEILTKQGVTEIAAQGQPFDPNRHNAVMHIEDENLGESMVANVFQAGFMLGDKVLRHTIVQVAN